MRTLPTCHYRRGSVPAPVDRCRRIARGGTQACSLYRLAGTAARRGALSCHTETHADIRICSSVSRFEPARGRCSATDCGGVEKRPGCALAAHGLASKWLDEAKSAPQAKKKMAVLVCRCRRVATVDRGLRENRDLEGRHRFYRFRTPLRGRTHRFYRALPFLLTTCNRNVTEM